MANKKPKDLLIEVFGRDVYDAFVEALRDNGYTGCVKFRVMSSRSFMQTAIYDDLVNMMPSYIDNAKQDGNYIARVDINATSVESYHARIRQQLIDIDTVAGVYLLNNKEANAIIRQADAFGLDYTETHLIWKHSEGFIGGMLSLNDFDCSADYRQLVKAYAKSKDSGDGTIQHYPYSKNWIILSILRDLFIEEKKFYEKLDELYSLVDSRRVEFAITISERTQNSSNKEVSPTIKAILADLVQTNDDVAVAKKYGLRPSYMRVLRHRNPEWFN